MSNTIRPKVSEAIKQIASSDNTGKSKSKIDTKKEFNALQDYLSGNYEELNTAEKNSIQRLLDNAKEYLKNTIGKEDLSTSKNDDTDQTLENTGNTESNNHDDLSISNNDDTDQTAENTGNIESNDDDSITKDTNDTNAYQQNHMPGKKVTHNGKICIEMPNGHLYDMQGRRIK